MNNLAVLGAVAALAFPLSIHQAYAQCAFDEPSKARSIKAELVRAYGECTTPNTDYLGLDACSGPTTLSAYEFGPNGACTVKLSARLETDCPFAAPVPCHDTIITIACKDVLESGGTVPVNGGAPWAAVITTRVTLADPNGSDLTFPDGEALFESESPANGTIRWRYRLAQLGCPLLECPHFPPGCTAMEVRTLELRDPDGAPFALLGLSTR